jgi:hypothetical protein
MLCVFIPVKPYGNMTGMREDGNEIGDLAPFLYRETVACINEIEVSDKNIIGYIQLFFGTYVC